MNPPKEKSSKKRAAKKTAVKAAKKTDGVVKRYKRVVIPAFGAVAERVTYETASEESEEDEDEDKDEDEDEDEDEVVPPKRGKKAGAKTLPRGARPNGIVQFPAAARAAKKTLPTKATEDEASTESSDAEASACEEEDEEVTEASEAEGSGTNSDAEPVPKKTRKVCC